ncbi:hypothetical protein GGH95_001082 [Coemansia sp. RSA 1836]|nr:hypothetical protein GGH95_001082 [Coemansia sp. RSA 1836]
MPTPSIEITEAPESNYGEFDLHLVIYIGDEIQVEEPISMQECTTYKEVLEKAQKILDFNVNDVKLFHFSNQTPSSYRDRRIFILNDNNKLLLKLRSSADDEASEPLE